MRTREGRVKDCVRVGLYQDERGAAVRGKELPVTGGMQAVVIRPFSQLAAEEQIKALNWGKAWIYEVREPFQPLLPRACELRGGRLSSHEDIWGVPKSLACRWTPLSSGI